MSDLLRIGLGIDLHRLVRGRRCVLGGIGIESPVGPEGHSDGDAILHAICDAVLGACGLDDLGTLFEDTDVAHRDADSRKFCREVLARARAAGCRVLALDVVVEAELPKLRPHREAIRQSIAELFNLELDRVNVKGKTAEGLDAIGHGAALRATAVALVSRQA